MKKNKEVKIIPNYNVTTDGESMHRIEFDGVAYEAIGEVFTEREAEIFRMGILEERERIWDESVELVDDQIIRRLLRHKRITCKICNWSGWEDELKNIIKLYSPLELACPKCDNILIKSK